MGPLSQGAKVEMQVLLDQTVPQTGDMLHFVFLTKWRQLSLESVIERQQRFLKPSRTFERQGRG